MAELVVLGAFRLVREGGVGFLDFLELGFRLRLVFVLIWMILLGQAAIGALDVRVACGPGDTEDIVVVALGHDVA